MSAVIPWLADAPCAVLPEQGVGEARTLLRMPSGSVAELAARARAAGAVPRVEGQPAGLADLQAAYRLTPELDFPA